MGFPMGDDLVVCAHSCSFLRKKERKEGRREEGRRERERGK